MIDYFALLGFERRPWLEADEVNSRFLALSSEAHPDRVHGGTDEALRNANQKFADLNAAAAALRDPKDRLQHLLKLEGATETAAHSIAPDLMNLFSEVGLLCREVDSFLAKKAKAESPMLQAQLFAQGLDLSDQIEALQKKVLTAKTNAESELQQISATWPAAKNLDRLKTLSHTLATTTRWQSQLKERFATLAAF
jgi:curved DNA-binding protein CbpA